MDAKTKFMLICTKPEHKKFSSADLKLSLNICGCELEVVKKIEYLGVLMDNRLDWKEHIKVVSSRISKALGIHAKAC